MLAAKDISSTTLRQRRSALSWVWGKILLPPMPSATLRPPVDNCIHFTSTTMATVAVMPKAKLPNRAQVK